MEELKNTVRSTEETVHMGFLIRTVGDPTTKKETLHPIFSSSEIFFQLCLRSDLRDGLAKQANRQPDPGRQLSHIIHNVKTFNVAGTEIYPN